MQAGIIASTKTWITRTRAVEPRPGRTFPYAQSTTVRGGRLVSQAGPRKFAGMHHLNISAIVARLSAKPFIRVDSGSFVGQVGIQEYELGSTEAGLARAIRRLGELRRELEAEAA